MELMALYMHISEIINKIVDGEKLYLIGKENKEFVYFENNNFYVSSKNKVFNIKDIKKFLESNFYHGFKGTFSESIYEKSIEKNNG